MLKTLIKKQFVECFRGYFVNRKTGKAQPAGKRVFLFIMFGILIAMLGSFSFGLGYMLNLSLRELPSELYFVYYALMGAGSLLFGVFGSVFNTYSSLYLPKDNDFLLSMPIRPMDILLSRLSVVFLLSLLYSGIVWLPAVICTWVTGTATVLSGLFGVILLFVIALFVTVITCALGWVIALAATRIRNKSIITALLAISFFVLYYYVCFNLSGIFEKLTENLSVIGGGVQKYGGLLYALGEAGNGSWSGMLIFTGVTVLLTALCLFVMERSYMRLLLRKPKAKRQNKALRAEKVHGVYSALLLREMKRFISSTAYLLNGGFGIFLMPLAAVVLFFMRGRVIEALQMLTLQMPQLPSLLPFCVTSMVCVIVMMDGITLPSVSLEGRSLWILQTLPVPAKTALRAKRDLHILMNGIPALILLLTACLVFGLGAAEILLSVLFMILFDVFTADFGLFLGLRHVDLKWTNETVLIKSNMSILIIMLVGIAVLGAYVLGGMMLSGFVTGYGMMGIGSAVVLILVLLLEKWLNTKGSAIFSHL